MAAMSTIETSVGRIGLARSGERPRNADPVPPRGRVGQERVASAAGAFRRQRPRDRDRLSRLWRQRAARRRDPRRLMRARRSPCSTRSDIDRAHICGLSLGGVVAIAIHALAPDRCASLILADSFAVHPDGQAIHDRSVAASQAMSMRALAEARAPLLLGAAASDAVKAEVIATMGAIDPAAYRLGARGGVARRPARRAPRRSTCRRWCWSARKTPSPRPRCRTTWPRSPEAPRATARPSRSRSSRTPAPRQPRAARRLQPARRPLPRAARSVRDEDHMHWRGAGGADLRHLDEAARPVARHPSVRAQCRGRDVRLGRGLFRPDGRQSDRQRPASGEQIARECAHWDDIDIRVHGQSIVSSGHGFIGIGRKRLLEILTDRARALGVVIALRVRGRRQRRRRLGPGHRRRRRQQPHPRCPRRSVRRQHRRARQPLHLARHAETVRRLHLRLRADRGRAGSGPTPIASPTIARPSSSNARPRPGPRSASRR